MATGRPLASPCSKKCAQDRDETGSRLADAACKPSDAEFRPMRSFGSQWTELCTSFEGTGVDEPLGILVEDSLGGLGNLSSEESSIY